MIQYKDYYISFDGLYPVINKGVISKSGKNKGELVLSPIYYPRDAEGVVKALLRLESNKVGTTTETLEELVKEIDKVSKRIEKHFKDKVIDKEKWCEKNTRKEKR